MAGFNKRWLQRIRVPLAIPFAVLLLVFAAPTWATVAAGTVIVLAGVAVRTWAVGHLRKASALSTTGPYAFVRNPLYLGSFILGGGFVLAANVWWLAVIFTVLMAGIYLPVAFVEEGDLRQLFGAEFENYRANVPAFFPRLSPWENSGEKFDFQLYLKSREYKACIGAAAALLFLASKVYWGF